MKTIITILATLPIFLSACTHDDGAFRPVHIKSKVDAVQPATGLVLWSDNAEDRNASYGKSISLEYAYCLPCRVVTGKQGGLIQYDWSSFDGWLADPEISKDGTLAGPAIGLYQRIMQEYPQLHLIASGGVSSIDDIRALDRAGIPAVVFGKAIYEGRIDLKELGQWSNNL